MKLNNWIFAIIITLLVFSFSFRIIQIEHSQNQKKLINNSFKIINQKNFLSYFPTLQKEVCKQKQMSTLNCITKSADRSTIFWFEE